MVRSEVKKLLDNRQASFQHVLTSVSNYVKSFTVFAPTVNKIIKKAQTKKQLTSMDLFVFFYEEMKDLVEGTKYCPNKYNAQMLLKSVWENTQLQTYIVQQIRKGYVLLDEPEDIEVIEDKPKPKKAKKKKETPEERKERLKKQAEAMRIAKAKKAGKEPKAPKKEEPVKQQAPQQAPQQQKELTPEQKQQLEMLKNLKI